MDRKEFIVWFCLFGFWECFALILPERFRVAAGTAGMLIFGAALAYSEGLVGTPAVPSVRLELWQLAPFVLFISLVSLVQQVIGERRLTTRAQTLSDSIADFARDQRGQGVTFGFNWRKIKKEYVERYGKKADRILRGTPYATESALEPAQLRDLEIPSIMLTAHLRALSQDRTSRRIKRCFRDALIGIVIFVWAWAAPAIAHGKWKHIVGAAAVTLGAIILLALMSGRRRESATEQHEEVALQQDKSDPRFKSELGNMVIIEGVLFIEFQITNVGPPTSIRRWQAGFRNADGRGIILSEEFLLEGEAHPSARVRGKNLSRDRRLLQTGETLEGWIAFDVGNARDVFSTVSLHFNDALDNDLHEVSGFPSWARELKR